MYGNVKLLVGFDEDRNLKAFELGTWLITGEGSKNALTNIIMRSLSQENGIINAPIKWMLPPSNKDETHINTKNVFRKYNRHMSAFITDEEVGYLTQKYGKCITVEDYIKAVQEIVDLRSVCKPYMFDWNVVHGYDVPACSPIILVVPASYWRQYRYLLEPLKEKSRDSQVYVMIIDEEGVLKEFTAFDLVLNAGDNFVTVDDKIYHYEAVLEKHINAYTKAFRDRKELLLERCPNFDFGIYITDGVMKATKEVFNSAGKLEAQRAFTQMVSFTNFYALSVLTQKPSIDIKDLGIDEHCSIQQDYQKVYITQANYEGDKDRKIYRYKMIRNLLNCIIGLEDRVYMSTEVCKNDDGHGHDCIKYNLYGAPGEGLSIHYHPHKVTM